MASKDNTVPIIIDRLWQGEAGTAPWQRLVGQVEDPSNIRFDMTAGGAAKRNATNLIAKLTSDTSTPVGGDVDFHWTSIRDAVIAIGKTDVYGWDLNGDVLEVTDNTSGALDTYLSTVSDPVTEISTAVAQSTIMVLNRLREPRTRQAWSFEQSYNYIVSGDEDGALSTPNFRNDRSGANQDVFRDFDELHEYFENEQPAELVGGKVVRLQFDLELDPRGFYVYVDASLAYAWADEVEKIFPEHASDWYRIPNGRGPSGQGNANGDVDNGQGRARWDPATMPFRIVYDEDAGTLTIENVPWRQRLSGSPHVNRSSSFDGSRNADERIRAMAFHSGRLFYLSDGFLASSRSNDFFNLFIDNVSAISDDDRIDVALGSNARGDRMSPLGTYLFIDGETGQYAFGTTDPVLTNGNGHVRGITDISSAGIPIGTSANEVYVLDNFGDVHQFRFMGHDVGIAYTALLTAHNRGALYGLTINRLMVTGNALFALSTVGTTKTVDMFTVGNELVQSAWGTMELLDPLVFVNEWDGQVRLVTQNESSDANVDGYDLLHYVHREVEPPTGLEYTPALDRMELVAPGDMAFDEDADETTIPHSNRDGILGQSMVVTTALAGGAVGSGGGSQRLAFIKPKRIDSSGYPVFPGDLTDDDAYLGFTFDASFKLSRLYPILTGRELLVRGVAVFHHGTTDYTTSWVLRDGSTDSVPWQGHRVGVSAIGEPPSESHFQEIAMNGVTSKTDITISSSSPGPMLITGLEMLVSASGRGSSS